MRATKPYKDPVTGDQLTRGEYASWLIQGIIRRWTFLIVVIFITILVWSTNNPTALTWWNLCASLLAIMIETIVGLAMFGQTKRDALVLREVRAIGKINDQQLESLSAQDQAMLAMLAKLEDQEELIVKLVEKQHRDDVS